MSSIGGVGSGMSAAALRQEISIAVMDKSLDVVQQQAQQLVQMLQTSAVPTNLGQNLDIRA